MQGLLWEFPIITDWKWWTVGMSPVTGVHTDPQPCLTPLQLSSVNSFLDSINNFLKLKDEELALSISAQRVDGYEVEGINEEIDKV